MDNPLIERLRRLDTCAVSDALDRAGLPGAALDLHAQSNARRIAGQAVTVELVPDEGTPGPRHLCTAAVDASGPGKVIVVAHAGRTAMAGWGGILSRGASRNNVEGVIIDGACRDLDESREFGLTVYARTAVPLTARGRVVERSWNEPVTVAGVAVKPGDLVIADASGVVFIPAAQASEIIEVAEKIAAREKLMMAAVDCGQSMETVMNGDYETMLRRENDR